MTRPIDELFEELSGPSRPLGPMSSADWPEPASLRRRAEHRRTVRRATIASSVAVVAVFAVAVPATLAAHRGNVSPAHVVTSTATHGIGPAPTPAKTATAKALPSQHAESPGTGQIATSPLVPGSRIPTGTRQRVGSISLVVPRGWTATPYDVPATFASPAHKVCIAPPVTPRQRSLDDCAGLEIWYDGFLPGAYGTSFAGNRETSPAWFHGKGPATCPDTGTTTGPAAVSPGGPAWDWNLLGLGDAAKSATHNTWTVSCADGSSFTPQSWYLPKSQIVMFSYVSNAEAQAILATVSWS